MTELTFTKEQCNEITNALTNFIVRVTNCNLSKPEETAILPTMTEIVLKHLSIKSNCSGESDKSINSTDNDINIAPKFTQGEWRLEDKNREVCCEHLPIADISYENLSLAEGEANARLIMYAPQMYEMLIRAFMGVDNTYLKSDIVSLLKNINNINDESI